METKPTVRNLRKRKGKGSISEENDANKMGRPSYNMKDWRDGLETMPQRWKAVMTSSIPDLAHDVTFLVGEEKKIISCHKLFLSVASPVFQAMFSDRHLTLDEIPIPDIDPQAFENLLMYVYLNDVDIKVEDAVTTMYAANKYDIPELTAYCSVFLQEFITKDNAVTVYKAAIKLEDKELETCVIEYITNHFQDLYDSDDFFELTIEDLLKFVSLDEILIQSEVNLFKAIYKWAIDQCQKKTLEQTTDNVLLVAQSVIDVIRFPLMRALEFADDVEPTEILSKDQCFNLYKYFSLPQTERYRVLSIHANSEPRTCPRSVVAKFVSFEKKFLRGLRNNDRDLQPHLKTKSFYDEFSCSSDFDCLELTAVGLVGMADIPDSDIDIKIEIFQYDDEKEDYFPMYQNLPVNSAKYSITVGKYAKPVYVYLKNPVFIMEDVNYRVQVTVPKEYRPCRGVTKHADTIESYDKTKCSAVNYKKRSGVICSLKFNL